METLNGELARYMVIYADGEKIPDVFGDQGQATATREEAELLADEHRAAGSAVTVLALDVSIPLTAPTGQEHIMKTIISTLLYGDVFSIRANWAEASSQIERDTEDGWEATGNQVADFSHDEQAAMRYELINSVRAGGDDPDDPRIADEIEEALRGATR